MTRLIVVTGAEGFIGANLVTRLREMVGIEVACFDKNDDFEDLRIALQSAEVVFHLAGSNRPNDPSEFQTVNQDLTIRMLEVLASQEHKPIFVLSSSTQAALDNPYGLSKRGAEEAVFGYAQAHQASVTVYRLPNVFGKWCRPNYNSVIATFCNNVAKGFPLQVNDPDRLVEFVHVDAVVEAFLAHLNEQAPPLPTPAYQTVHPVLSVTLGDLADRIRTIGEGRLGCELPDLADTLTRYLHSIFLTYLEPSALDIGMDRKTDERGYLFEMVKSKHAGQVFFSVTKPGITRGNHYHHTKVERFFVVQGEGLIRIRHILKDEVIEFKVKGEDCRAVDIPPGFTHSITNVGMVDMHVLFWANEPFDQTRPDTFRKEV